MAEDECFPNMADLRAEIDRIDAELVELLARRAGCIDRAVAIKRRISLPARIDSRVAEVLDRTRRAGAERGLEPAFVEGLWRNIIEWSIAREERALDGSGERDDGR